MEIPVRGRGDGECGGEEGEEEEGIVALVRNFCCVEELDGDGETGRVVR